MGVRSTGVLQTSVEKTWADPASQFSKMNRWAFRAPMVGGSKVGHPKAVHHWKLAD
jgi:hypothetical protein